MYQGRSAPLITAVVIVNIIVDINIDCFVNVRLGHMLLCIALNIACAVRLYSCLLTRHDSDNVISADDLLLVIGQRFLQPS